MQNTFEFTFTLNISVDTASLSAFTFTAANGWSLVKERLDNLFNDNTYSLLVFL